MSDDRGLAKSAVVSKGNPLKRPLGTSPNSNDADHRLIDRLFPERRFPPVGLEPLDAVTDHIYDAVVAAASSSDSRDRVLKEHATRDDATELYIRFAQIHWNIEFDESRPGRRDRLPIKPLDNKQIPVRRRARKGEVGDGAVEDYAAMPRSDRLANGVGVRFTSSGSARERAETLIHDIAVVIVNAARGAKSLSPDPAGIESPPPGATERESRHLINASRDNIGAATGPGDPVVEAIGSGVPGEEGQLIDAGSASGAEARLHVDDSSRNQVASSEGCIDSLRSQLNNLLSDPLAYLEPREAVAAARKAFAVADEIEALSPQDAAQPRLRALRKLASAHELWGDASAERRAREGAVQVAKEARDALPEGDERIADFTESLRDSYAALAGFYYRTNDPFGPAENQLLAIKADTLLEQYRSAGVHPLTLRADLHFDAGKYMIEDPLRSESESVNQFLVAIDMYATLGDSLWRDHAIDDSVIDRLRGRVLLANSSVAVLLCLAGRPDEAGKAVGSFREWVYGKSLWFADFDPNRAVARYIEKEGHASFAGFYDIGFEWLAAWRDVQRSLSLLPSGVPSDMFDGTEPKARLQEIHRIVWAGENEHFLMRNEF